MVCLLVVLSRCVSYMNVVTSLAQYESCNSWLDSFKSESTKSAYSTHVLLFCRFYEISPDDSIKIEPNNLKSMIINYISEMKKRVRELRASQNVVKYPLIALNFISMGFDLFWTSMK
jgi:hypothetical protein